MGSVSFNFTTAGHAEVEAAFKSIGKAARQAKTEVAASLRGQASAHQAHARKVEATAKKAEDATARAEAKRVKEVQKSSQKIQREYDKDARAAEKAAARAYKANQRVHAARVKAFGKAAGAVGGAVAGAGLTAGALALGTIGAASRDAMRLQEASNRLSINSRGAGQKFVDSNALQKEFSATAIGTPGIKAQDIAEGVGRFVAKTGDLETGRSLQGVAATVASASGTDIKDIFDSMADLSSKFQIKDIEMMKQSLADLFLQSKEGSFELSDMASQIAKSAAAAEKFGFDKSPKGVKELGGLLQLARKATGSPEQAATAMDSMLSQLTTKSGDLAAKGINVFDKKTGKANNIQDVLVDLVSKTGGADMAKKKAGVATILGEQGSRGISTLMSKFEEGFNSAGPKATDAEKTAAGIKAMRAELDKTINVQSTYSEVQLDAAQAQTDMSAKLTAAWERLTASAADDLAPALTNLVSELAGNEQIWSVAAFAVDVLSENAKFASDALKLFGVGLGATKTHAQVAQDAGKQISRLDKERQGIFAKARAGTATDEDLARLDQLNSEMANQRGIKKDAEGKAATTDLKTAGLQMTEEEFKKRRLEELKGSGFTDAVKNRIVDDEAQRIKDNPDQGGKRTAAQEAFQVEIANQKAIADSAINTAKNMALTAEEAAKLHEIFRDAANAAREQPLGNRPR